MQVKLLRILQEDTFDAALPWHHGGHGEGAQFSWSLGAALRQG
ncbi:hypothetical protein [Acidovorax sp. SD340]|uniref:Uncharacterized protein n=1 Tax=Acidovorax facilis TaxID=12917 RepID=A0ABV8DDQ2_9BURK|nr:hypothetical protein [Acidovorax sp. SD340]